MANFGSSAEGLNSDSQHQSSIFLNQIDKFVHGKLNAEDRASFVAALQKDRSLRQAVTEARSCYTSDDIYVSEQASSLLSQQTAALRAGNTNFPGESGIAGLENRPDIAPARERSYKKVIDLSEQAMQLGELEDIFIENAYRATENIAAGREAQQAFGGYSEVSSLRGMFSTMAGVIPRGRSSHTGRTIADRYDPLYLTLAPSPVVDINQVSITELESSAVIRDCISGLAQLFPDNRGLSHIRIWHVDNEYDNPQTAQRLLAQLVKSKELRQAFAEYVESPIAGAKPGELVAGKLMAARLLLDDYAVRNDTSSLDPVVNLYGSLDGRLSANALTDYTADLLDGIGQLLASYANEHDEVWAVMKPIFYGALNSDRLGLPKNLRSGFGSDMNLKLLEKLPQRVANDSDINEQVRTFAAGASTFVRSRVATVVPHLQKQAAVQTLLGFVAKEHSEYPEDPLNSHVSNGSAHDVQRAGISQLCEYPAADLKSLVIDGNSISDRLKGVTTVLNAAEKLLERNIEKDRVGYGYGEPELSLLKLIAKLDSDRLKHWFPKLAAAWNGPRDSAYLIRGFAKDYNLQDMKENLIDVMSRSTLDGFRYRDWVEFFSEWGVAEEQLLRKLVQRFLEQPLDQYDQDTVLIFCRGPIISEAMAVFTRALESKNNLVRYQAIRTLCGEQYSAFMSYEQIDKLLDNLKDTDSFRLGYLGSYTTMADVTQENLGLALESSRKDLIKECVQARVMTELPPTGSVPSKSTKAMLKRLASIGVKVKKPRSKELKGAQAYVELLTRKPVSSVFNRFIDTLGKDTEKLSSSELDAQCYIACLSGGNYEALVSYLEQELGDDIEQKEALKALDNVLGSEAHQTQPQELERRLAFTAAALVNPKLHGRSKTFSELSADLLSSYDQLDNSKQEFSDLERAFVSAALFRVGEFDKACSFLKSNPIEIVSYFGQVAFYGVLAAEDAQQSGNSEVAIERLKVMQSVLEPVKDLYAFDIDQIARKISIIQAEMN